MKKNQSYDLYKIFEDYLVDKNHDEAIKRWVAGSRVVTKKKGELIIAPEVEGPRTIFLLDGIIKSYILCPDGTENIYAFYHIPTTFVCLTEDMINIPGIYMTAVSRTTYIDVNPSPWELAKEFPGLYKEILIGFDPFYDRMMNKFRVGYTMTAKERYLWFLEQFAPVADKVSLSETAQFLGIQPQSLSRIRAELQEEGIINPPPENLAA